MSMEDEMFHKSFPIINQNPMTIVDKTLLIDSVLKVQSGQIMDAYPSYYFIPEQPMVCNNHITSHENMMNRPMLPSSFPESTNNGTCNSLSSYYVVGSSESGRFLDQTFMYHMPTDQVPHKFTEVNYSGLTEITCQESRNSDITGKTTAFPQVLHISDHSGLESSHGNVQEIKFPEVCFSKTLLGSKYLNVAQQILVQIARCGLEDQKEKDHQLPDITKNKPCLSFSCPSYQGDDHETLLCCNFKSKKAALSSLMQMIDQRYNHCIAQMNKVMAAFHDATENSDVQMLSWFAFQMVSVSYKNMRDKISTEIHSSSEQLISKNNTGENTTVESSHFQNGMVRRNEQQSWRPQRGLPEKSVSILKEWMFQNFLHPYPNDAVKHFLAIKSGLTRNQVSNWFINARVRIWKPMIEEMYMEYNRKLRTDRLVAI